MTDYVPYHIFGENRTGRYVITVDHAANTVPDWVNGGDLGLDPEDMGRHIAYDVGATGVAQKLGMLLDSPVIASNFSRLVIDPNRGIDDPTLVMQLYDGTIIPGNHPLDETARQDRIDRLYQPYHDAYAALLETREDPVILAIHSFTPQLKGRPPRPWEIGILFAEDRRMSDPLIDILQQEAGLTVGVNEPYVGYLRGDSVDKHSLSGGHNYALIELRNDLIETPDGQDAWAERLAPMIAQALLKAES